MFTKEANEKPSAGSSPTWSRLFLPGCLLVYLVLAVTYSFIFPLGQAPDEPAHVHYVLFVAEQGRLPRFYADDVGYESYQAPLYYTLSAAVCKLSWALTGSPRTEGPRVAALPSELEARDADEALVRRLRTNPLVPTQQHRLALAALRWAQALDPAHRRAWHAVRLSTALLGAIGVLLCYRIILVVFPERPHLAAMVAAAVAFQPMYVHISSAVGNDPAAVAVLGAGVLVVLLVLRDGPRPGNVALLGVVLGLGMLTKDSANIAIPAALLTLIWATGRRHEPEPSPSLIVNLGRWLAALRWGGLLRWAGLMLGVALAVGGWWYVRNTMLYGKPMHYPANVDIQLPWDFYLIYPEWLWSALRLSLPMTFRNFWANFGWTNVALPLSLYYVLFALCLLPLVGCLGLIADARAGRLGWSLLQRRSLAVLVIVLALMAIAVTGHALFIGLGGGSQGRYYFPMLPSLGMLAALGIDRLLPHGAKKAAPFVVGGLMVLFNLYCLFAYIIPYYRALTHIL